MQPERDSLCVDFGVSSAAADVTGVLDIDEAAVDDVLLLNSSTKTTQIVFPMLSSLKQDPILLDLFVCHNIPVNLRQAVGQKLIRSA